ncbi:hypothetical protein F3Y22_tig00111166pilonHSYRG00164 [Hibiscus syriacus]|uniref:Uncharacterized protein n=1 Tax=Hibiscus syriacus TaxID=106335 RepID=A0A6A2YX02_HIBSY|nr:hypothetical protein F3Y22_tig00111166pilonHSYRG00164 [Hibiscus syriacus]
MELKMAPTAIPMLTEELLPWKLWWPWFSPVSLLAKQSHRCFVFESFVCKTMLEGFVSHDFGLTKEQYFNEFKSLKIVQLKQGGFYQWRVSKNDFFHSLCRGNAILASALLGVFDEWTSFSLSAVNPKAAAGTGSVNEPLGSSVYLRQRDLLQEFCQGNASFSRNSLATQLRNFQNPASASNYALTKHPRRQLMPMIVRRINSEENMQVDAKIQAICQKVKRERAKNKAKDGNSDRPVAEAEKDVKAWNRVRLMMAEEAQFEDCSLARMPSFDAELLWEILAN